MIAIIYFRETIRSYIIDDYNILPTLLTLCYIKL